MVLELDSHRVTVEHSLRLHGEYIFGTARDTIFDPERKLKVDLIV